MKHFFTFHDPTSRGIQGFDRGPYDRGKQFSSTIFTHSEKQKDVALKLIDLVNKLIKDDTIYYNWGKHSVKTKVFPAGEYFPSADGHQRYQEVYPHSDITHKIRFDWKTVEAELEEWKNGKGGREITQKTTRIPKYHKKAKEKPWIDTVEIPKEEADKELDYLKPIFETKKKTKEKKEESN